MTVWCNGQFVKKLHLNPAERGLMLGDGVFETIAVRDGIAVWLDEHVTRLVSAAEELGITCEVTKIRSAISAVLARSNATSEVLRVTLTRGPTLRGLATDGKTPSLIISLGAFDRATLPTSVRLATTSIRRNTTSPASHLKTLSYIDAIAAAREVATHADDALMLNTDGNVACATVANIFLLKAKMLITPADDQAILKGITRGKLIEGASKLGLGIECRAVRPAELHDADAVFLTNSLRLAVAVASVDGTACGNKPNTFIHTFLIATK